VDVRRTRYGFCEKGGILFTSGIFAKRPVNLVLAGVAVAAALMFGAQPTTAFADTAPTPPEPETVSNDALPTVQVDGVVWTQVVVGDTVYVGGNFANARPAGAAPGTNTTPRSNILAYNVTTGVLNTSFAPTLNGQVLGLAASPDGTRIYATGDFTNASGVNKYRAVALNASNGSVITSFSPGFNARTRTVVATNDTVYFGGIFSNVSGVTRTRLAAVRASNGAVLDWAPTAGNNQVTSLALTPDNSKLVVGGSFTTLNGQTAYGLGAVDPATGATVPWDAANLIKNAGTKAGITNLTASNTAIYGTGYVYGSEAGIPKGNLEGAFSASPNSGAINWVDSCHGDSYATYAMNGVSYSVGHKHDCRGVGGFPQTDPWTFYRGVAFTENATGVNKTETVGGYYNFAGVPAPSPLTWYPDLTAGTFTGQTQAAWSISGNSDYLVLGGEFPSVNGVAQQGLVRFARKGLAPNKSGPKLHGANYKPALSSPAEGVVRGLIGADYDMDNELLTYNVYRQGLGTPIYTTTVRSNFYTRPNIAFKDTGLTGGQTYNYRVAVSDPMGNNVTGDWTPVTVSTTGSISGYGLGVLDDAASLYWRLGEGSGTVANDWAGANTGTISGTVTRGAAGAIIGDADTATTFAGDANPSNVRTSTLTTGPQQFALEAWIKTTTTKGGKIIGFGNALTGNSSNYDRHIYMQNNGKLTFGVYPDAVKTVTSAQSYNDGQYHHVVAQLGSGGIQLFVDGQLVGNDPSVTSAQTYSGYWRVGGDNMGGWTGQPTSTYFAGTIDDVAIYGAPMSPQKVSTHWSLSGHGAPLPNVLPTAAFTSSANRLAASFDASTSTDSDGTISSYAWDFGDGATGTGVTAAHAYGAPGTYSVKLKVTDNAGGNNEVSHDITVTDPNTLPTAAFSFTTNDLTASLNATGSNDPDGSIAAYDWDFGDGQTGTGSTVDHAYAVAGTYPVKLTVTDNRGGTAEITKSVKVTAPTPALALDDFDRIVANGWGTSTKGGAWTAAGTASNFAVSGGVGAITVPLGNTRTASLNAISATSTDTTVDVAVNRPEVGSTYSSVIGRRVNATDDYRVKLRFFANGDLNATLVRNIGGVETTLAGGRVTGLVYNSNDVLHVRLQVTGTAPTLLKAKVWRATDTEPATWNAQTSDSTAGLQVAGGVGFQGYVSNTVGNTPAVMKFDNLSVFPVTP